MTARVSTQTYELNSSPVFALGREVTLLVGVEEQPDGKVRAYLGHRAKGLYLLLDPEEADPFRRAWATGQHVWMAPVPPADLLYSDSDGDSMADQGDGDGDPEFCETCDGDGGWTETVEASDGRDADVDIPCHECGGSGLQ